MSIPQKKSIFKRKKRWKQKWFKDHVNAGTAAKAQKSSKAHERPLGKWHRERIIMPPLWRIHWQRCKQLYRTQKEHRKQQRRRGPR
jgi:hypothetical protein